MSKYIIDVGDAYTEYDVRGESDMLCLPVRINEFEDNWLNTNIPLTPYTEPDTEKIRKEAYDEGYQEGMQLSIDDAKLKEAYQRGLNDIWAAMRKIKNISYPTQSVMFGMSGIANILEDCSASQVVEKIQAYEQEQEQKQEICIGDEIITTSGLYAICSNIDNIKEGWVYLFFDDGSCGAHKIGEIKKKTGKNYPEIATLLQGMTKT